MEGHTQPPEDSAEEPVLKKQRTEEYGILSDYIHIYISIFAIKSGFNVANVELMEMETEVQA